MKEHSIVIETCITTEDITNFLAMEGNGFDYWAEICSDDADYEAARQRLMDGDMRMYWRKSWKTAASLPFMTARKTRITS